MRLVPENDRPLPKRLATEETAAAIPCPCCSHLVAAPSLFMIIERYGISDFQASILKVVWEGGGLPVPAEKIFDRMYADDRDGGPETPKMYAAFKEALHRLRAKLAGSGIDIVNSGYMRGYKLVILPPAPARHAA